MADGKVIENAVTLDGLATFLERLRETFAAIGDAGGSVPATVGELPDGTES